MANQNGSKEQQPVIVVKKVVKGGGHHGGAWKVAYADFVTAMMAFFLVMWITSMDPSTKDGIQGYFNDPMGKANKYAGGAGGMDGSRTIGIHINPLTAWREAQKGRFEMVKIRLEKALKQEAEFQGLNEFVDINITDEGLVIELLDSEESFFFESGSAQMKPRAVRLLGIIAKEVGDLPNPVALEGHTDIVPFARGRYTNWQLSTDRANAAREAMYHTGLRAGQLQEIRGYGPTRLRRPDEPRHFSNRRVSILALYTNDVPPGFVTVDTTGKPTGSDSGTAQ